MLPRGWVAAALEDIIEEIETDDPKNKPSDEFWYIDISSIDNVNFEVSEPKKMIGREAPSRARRRVRFGDILFSTVRPYLRNIAMVPKSLDGGLTSTGICVLRPSDDIEQGFVFKRVLSQDFIDKMTLASDGTMYPAISDKDVFRAQILLPPSAEQRRIVVKLEALTARLARVRADLLKVPHLLEKQKDTYLRTAFEGKLTSYWVQNQNRKSTNWKSVLAGDLIEWASGKNLPAKKQEVGGVPVIGGNGLSGYHNAHLIDHDTIVIGRVGAQCGNVHFSSGPAWITDNAIYARKISPELHPRFATLFLRSKKLNGFAGGTGQPYVSQSILNRVTFLLPPFEEQAEVVRLLELAFARADIVGAHAAKAVKLLDRLEAAILAKAFKGELVPQDPNDEPASVLLARIRAQREAAAKVPGGRGGRRKAE